MKAQKIILIVMFMIYLNTLCPRYRDKNLVRITRSPVNELSRKRVVLLTRTEVGSPLTGLSR